MSNSSRMPPQSIEAEQSLLGSVMLDASKWDDISEMLSVEDFYRPAHQHIFQAVANLMDANEPCDIITVANQLVLAGQLDAVGGRDYLIALVDDSGDPVNAKAYARIVRDRSLLRRLISTSVDLVDKAFDPGTVDAESLLSEAERAILAISEQKKDQGGLIGIESIATDALELVEQRFRNQADVTGIPTGFKDMDRMTSGLQNGDLLIVAARPSMGKTAFSMNLVETALLSQEDAVVVFSLEMPAAQLTTRLFSSMGRIDASKLRDGNLQPEDFTKLTGAYTTLKGRKLFIDDTPGLGPSEMKARLRRLSREHPKIALIMIDYLQLMQIKGFKEGRTGEISEISRSLKGIAREFNCPVIALSQLNRSVEQRPNKRPMNSDLRESGAIEQDADLIIFLYRDEYYNPDSPDKGTAEIIIGKHRNGETGSLRLAFQNQYTRFSDLAPDYYSEAPAGMGE